MPSRQTLTDRVRNPRGAQYVPQITMGSPLHQYLASLEPDAEALGDRPVSGTHQQEAQIGFSDFLKEPRVLTA
jgi:hypothetical protein